MRGGFGKIIVGKWKKNSSEIKVALKSIFGYPVIIEKQFLNELKTRKTQEDFKKEFMKECLLHWI